MRTVSFLLFIALFQVAIANHLGSVSISFQDEDPATGANVDAIISIGDSLEVTITLDPAPLLPIRFDIISSLPDIIKVSHSRITFNRGQTVGVVTLESPSDGRIGVSTIIVTPEKSGFYAPITFDILVQGKILVDFFQEDPCISVGIPTDFIIQIDPASPETIEIPLRATNGELSTETAIIPLGQNSVIVSYTGTSVGSSVLTASTELYVSNSIDFETLATIVTEHEEFFVEDIPNISFVSVVPSSPSVLPNIFVTASNAIVTPNSFTLGSDGVSAVEIIPIHAGVAQVTYSANGYCPHVDTVNVSPALLCSSGFVPNIQSTECVPCPGAIFSASGPSINCNDEGTCSYSKCFDDRAVCFCFFPFIGSACQFNTQDNNGLFDEHLLNDRQFRMSLDGLRGTSDTTKFLAPGNLINETLQPGRAIVAAYHPDNLFFGAINPSTNPPANSIFSGISWNWENTCFENAIITDEFLTAPVSVRLSIVANAFTDLEILQVELRLWDSELGEWIRSLDVCQQVGFDTTLFVDFFEMTITTAFCRPGQYALFVVPNDAPVANTGNTNPPFPTLDQHSGTSPGTGRTGWQPAPPLPLPVQENFEAYRPSLKPASSSGASSIVMSMFLVIVAALIL